MSPRDLIIAQLTDCSDFFSSLLVSEVGSILTARTAMHQRTVISMRIT